MAYTNFTLELIEERLGIKNRVVHFSKPSKPVLPSDRLSADLEEIKSYPLRTEKAKSEAIVFPILRELRRINADFFTIYSGENLDADAKKGLKGECDFILAKNVGSYSINYPIIQIVEAKKNDLDLGIPQCAAQMIGAKVFNERKGIQLEKIYGCVTTGDEWLFIKLEKEIEIDTEIYYLNQLPQVLGFFQDIIDYYKEILK